MRSQSRANKQKLVYPSLPSSTTTAMELVGSTSLTLSGQCRIRIRSKKWYWPQVVFGIDVSLVNAWMLYRRSRTCSSGVQVLLATPVIDRLRGGAVRPHTSQHVQHEVRRDGKEHRDAEIPTQRRCGKCEKCTKTVCVKCSVSLHVKRFAQFHQ